MLKDTELVVTVSIRNILTRSPFKVRKSEKPQQLEFATDCGLFLPVEMLLLSCNLLVLWVWCQCLLSYF